MAGPVCFFLAEWGFEPGSHSSCNTNHSVSSIIIYIHSLDNLFLFSDNLKQVKNGSLNHILPYVLYVTFFIPPFLQVAWVDSPALFNLHKNHASNLHWNSQCLRSSRESYGWMRIWTCISTALIPHANQWHTCSTTLKVQLRPVTLDSGCFPTGLVQRILWGGNQYKIIHFIQNSSSSL